MSLSKFALLACGVTMAMAAGTASLRAQNTDFEGMSVQDRSVFFLNPTGKLQHMRLNAAGQAEMLKHARALQHGVMVFRSGGKVYVVEDKMMPNGKMMLDIAKGNAIQN